MNQMLVSKIFLSIWGASTPRPPIPHPLHPLKSILIVEQGRLFFLVLTQLSDLIKSRNIANVFLKIHVLYLTVLSKLLINRCAFVFKISNKCILQQKSINVPCARALRASSSFALRKFSVPAAWKNVHVWLDSRMFFVIAVREKFGSFHY